MQPVLVTGIRVLDLICPIRRGGTLAISGDADSGVNVLAMEAMQNLCRRYTATAICRVTAKEPFNASNVNGWVDKLRVRSCITEIIPGRRAEISITSRLWDLQPRSDQQERTIEETRTRAPQTPRVRGAGPAPAGVIATLLPFAQSGERADAWAVIRRAVFETGRLPAVALDESWSTLTDDDSAGLTQRVKAEVARGNAELINYLSQPFCVAEPWTSRPGEVTERQETLERVQRLMAPADSY